MPAKITISLVPKLFDGDESEWQCDIFPIDGYSHHGRGPTESIAVRNATEAWMDWEVKVGRSPQKEDQ